MVNSNTVLSDLELKFTALESGIQKAVDKIRALTAQKADLESSLRDTQLKVEKLESLIIEFQARESEAEKWREQVQDLNKVKLMVAGKIESLLGKLEDLSVADV